MTLTMKRLTIRLKLHGALLALLAGLSLLSGILGDISAAGFFGLLFPDVFTDEVLLDDAGKGAGHDVEVDTGRCIVKEDEHHNGHHDEHHLLLLCHLWIGLSHRLLRGELLLEDHADTQQYG